MKHLEVRQKYSAARRIFNSLLGVSSGDETLRLMLDILRKEMQYQFQHRSTRANSVVSVPYTWAQPYHPQQWQPWTAVSSS